MELLLQPLQQRQDLRLDGDVEGGGRLVGDQQLRPADECHRDHDPLPHAARKLVRVRVHALLRIGHAHARSISTAVEVASSAPMPVCSCRASLIWKPMVYTGVSALIGS